MPVEGFMAQAARMESEAAAKVQSAEDKKNANNKDQVLTLNLSKDTDTSRFRQGSATAEVGRAALEVGKAGVEAVKTEFANADVRAEQHRAELGERVSKGAEKVSAGIKSLKTSAASGVSKLKSWFQGRDKGESLKIFAEGPGAAANESRMNDAENKIHLVVESAQVLEAKMDKGVGDRAKLELVSKAVVAESGTAAEMPVEAPATVEAAPEVAESMSEQDREQVLKSVDDALSKKGMSAANRAHLNAVKGSLSQMRNAA